MNLEPHDSGPSSEGPLRKRPRGIFIVFFLAFSAGLLIVPDREPETQIRHSLQSVELPAVDAAVPEVRREVLESIVGKGETLSTLLDDYLKPEEIHHIAQASRNVFSIRRIRAGQPYQVWLEDGVFESFVYEIDRLEQFVVCRKEGGFDVSRLPIPHTVERVLVQGAISSNLFEAMERAGGDTELAIALAEIFAWEVDFFRDLRKGDTFKFLVEQRFRDEKPAGYGCILAAEFQNQERTSRAVLFQDGKEPPSYYTPEGKSLQKAFLKAPLSYSRISSGFSKKRFHPISKTWKPHPAIDYAAPAGTPIKTVGSGTVLQAGYTRNNGNYVKIRHKDGFETTYLHMSRFAKGIRKGTAVAQGQLIGYVGSTGLATGPHLCFRMTKNGQPFNPRRMNSPSASPVSGQNLAEFKAMAADLLAKLDVKPVGPRGAMKVASSAGR